MALDIKNEKAQFTKAIADYFGNPVFVRGKENENFCIYYARIGCLLCEDNRYLVVVTRRKEWIDNPYINEEANPYEARLSDLSWVSFQTRTIEPCPIRGLKIQDTQSKQHPLILSKIKLIKKEKDRYFYNTPMNAIPITIELLLPNEDETYAESGTIQSALETYNCVISFIL